MVQEINVNFSRVANTQEEVLDSEYWKFFVYLVDELIEQIKKDLGYTLSLSYEKVKVAQGQIAGIEKVMGIPDKIKKILEAK